MKLLWIGNFKGDHSQAHTGYHQALAFQHIGWEVSLCDWREIPHGSSLLNCYDFIYNTDSSDEYDINGAHIPIVFWCGDPQIDLGTNNWRLRRAQQAQITFVPHTKGKDILEGYGVQNVHVVRWGWSKHWVKKANVSKKRLVDVECIGNPTCNERVQIWDLLKQMDIRVHTGTVYDKTLFNEIMSNSKIGIQNNSMPHDDHYPNRPLEIMASGQMLIKQRLSTDEFDKYFTEGEDFVYYDDLPDLKRKVHQYLKDSKERQRIATNGQRKALFHEYDYKAMAMADVIITGLNND